MMCEKLNINIWNTINAASTKNFGFMKFLPSAGTGGHCIPVDPTYLLWKAKSKNFFSKFIELSNQINSEMPRYVISRISNFLNKNSKSLKNTKIFLIGLAYKKDVDDFRESSSVEVFKDLVTMGSKVQFHDNFIKNIKINGIEYKSLSLTENNIKHHDIIVILTDHSYINWKIIYKKSKLIFDTRNVFNKYDENKKIQLL
jgi:UDP-N-acetyl-D-glucosamine dehydrogenase